MDPIYKQAVQEAMDCGVKIITLQIKWNERGEAYFITDCLPMN